LKRNARDLFENDVRDLVLGEADIVVEGYFGEKGGMDFKRADSQRVRLKTACGDRQAQQTPYGDQNPKEPGCGAVEGAPMQGQLPQEYYI
jgi:hypothetical protein